MTPFRIRQHRGCSGDRRPPLLDSRTLFSTDRQRVRILCYFAAAKEVETRANGRMCFVCLEDEFGMFQGVVYPEVYPALLPELRRGRVFVVTGTVETDSCGAVGHLLAVESIHKP